MADAPNESTTGARAQPGVDLHLELHGPRLREGLTDSLRDAIRSGRLAPGAKMPASRALAADLGIARSTVTECYSMLVEEGWLVARHGSGTRVAERAEAARDPAARAVPTAAQQRAHGLGPGV